MDFNFNNTYIDESANSRNNAVDSLEYKDFFPIDLNFETVHPDNPEQHFTVAFFTPTYQHIHTYSVDDPHNPVHRSGLHQHTYFELIYVIEGEMYQNIEHKRHLYSKGSLCLLNRNIHHAEEFTSDFRAAFLSLPIPLIDELMNHTNQFYFPCEQNYQFRELHEFFNHNLNDSSKSVREYIDFIPYHTQTEEIHDMYDRFTNLTHIFVNPSSGSTFILKGLLLQILSALSDKTLYNTIPINIGSEKEAKIFDQISTLITQNKGRISRSEISSQLKYDGSYLNKICKKYSGLNLFDYSTVICMKEAKRLLEETDLSVTEIADQLSFSNRTHFFKLFKEQYSMTPKKYRSSLQHNKS